MSLLISVAITLLILAVVVWLALYLVDLIPDSNPPTPFKRLAKIVIILIAVLYLLGLLLGTFPVRFHV